MVLLVPLWDKYECHFNCSIGEPIVSTPATTTTTTSIASGKPSVKTAGIDKSKLEQVWEKSLGTGFSNENEGLGIKKKLEEVIIPDILPNISKSRIQLKLKQQQQQHQQIQKLKEQQGITLRNPEFNDTQNLGMSQLMKSLVVVSIMITTKLMKFMI